jgi:uncharacterized protein YbjT (DUF2867 family)
MATMQKVIVFGANGNVGRAILAELVNRKYDVTAVIRSENRAEMLGSLPIKVQVTNPLDKPALEGVCAGQDVVISALGKSVSPMNRSTDSFYQVDLIGNTNILQEALRSGVRKFVYVSAFHSEKYQHLEYFRVHHLFSELLQKSTLDYSIIKPNAIFSAFQDMITMARKGLLVNLGRGDKKTNPIYESDLARICVDAIVLSNSIIEAGGVNIYTRKQLLEIVQQEVAPQQRIRNLPGAIFSLLLPITRMMDINTYHKLAFFREVMRHDTIAPRLGEFSFESYIRLKKQERGV